MAQNEGRDWIVPGAQVALYQASGHHVSLTTVDRLTATQVVLANGRRYRLDNLRQEIGDRHSRTPRQLLPVTDWRVVRALAGARVSGPVHELDQLLRVRSRTATPAELLALLDQAQKAITAARQRVAELVPAPEYSGSAADAAEADR